MSDAIKKFNYFRIASYIPLSFLIALGFGLLFFRVFPDRLFDNALLSYIFSGIFFILGTALVFFAEKERHTVFTQSETLVCNDFASGVYKKSRHPVAFGFIILFIGLACIINAQALIITAIIHFILLSLILIPLLEKEILNYCGSEYQKYRDTVRMWI